MYWPNEPAHLYPEFRQAGGRGAFEAMLADGTITALNTYSQRVERSTFADAAAFERAARDEVAAFAPDILFVQHLQGTDVSAAFWTWLRRELPKTTLIFHDDDPYDPLAKRIDAATAAITRVADLVFLSGLGKLAELFRRHGARSIGYMPSCFMAERFGRLEPASAGKTCQVAMIGNRGRRRQLRFLHVPGGRRRVTFVHSLAAAFGSEFSLYGDGWSDLSVSRGAVPYFQQEDVIQSARFTANWDHFDSIEYYFSDRLPISLASGVPHVTTWHVGYDQIFRDCPALYPCRTIAEAVDACLWLSSRSDDELLQEGLAGKRWAYDNLEATGVFRRAVEQSIAVHRQRLAR